MARHQPSVLLIGNGAPGQIGGSFARALVELGHPYRMVDEAQAFAPPARYLALRAIDRLTRRQFEIRRFNRVVIDTAREMRPDIVLVAQGYHLWADTLRHVRDETRATLICFSTDNPLVPGQLRRNVFASIPEYDVYASPRRSNLAALAAHGCRNPVHVRFAYEPALHFPERDTTSRWTSDVAFIGGWDRERVEWFDPLSREGGVELRLYGRGWSNTSLQRHASGEVFGQSFRYAMAGTKIAPCLVRGSNSDGHSMRSFEIPACGAFMLAERTEEHLELFDEDVHAAYCTTPEELRDKARFYLAHESQRASMATAAHQLVTGRGHRYRDRLEQLLSLAAGRATPMVARTTPAPMPVFVINLPRSRDRRAAMIERCAALGLEPSFVDAHDGESLEQSAAALSRSECGCLMSHCDIWQRIVDDNIAMACILEDDCDLDPNVSGLLESMARERAHFDVVLLGHHSARHDARHGVETCYRALPLDHRYRLGRVAEFAMGAYAYVVTIDGARKLLTLAQPLRMPADWVTGYAPSSGARLFAITPPCAWPDRQLAQATTMKDRWNGAAGPPIPANHDGLLRRVAGSALLFSRKLGLRPNAYVRHL